MIDCPRITYRENLIVAKSSLAVRVLSLSLCYRIVTVDSMSQEVVIMRRMAGLPISICRLPFRDVKAIVYQFGRDDAARIGPASYRPGRFFVGLRTLTSQDV